MDLSKLRSTTPKSRPAPIRPARPVNGPRPDKATGPLAPVTPGRPALVTQATPPTRVRQVPPVPAAQAQETDEMRLRRVIDKAIAAAYSDTLPPDAPGVQRTLETRRRGYVYAALVHFTSYNAPYRDDPNATLQAVILAHTALAERMKGANGTGQPAAPVAAPVAAPAPVAPVAPPLVAPDPADPLIAAVLRGMDKLEAAGRWFTDEHIAKNPRLKEAAVRYLDAYDKTGNERADKFMFSVRSKLDVRPTLRAASMSDKQARAVLNVWLERRIATRTPQASGK